MWKWTQRILWTNGMKWLLSCNVTVQFFPCESYRYGIQGFSKCTVNSQLSIKLGGTGNADNQFCRCNPQNNQKWTPKYFQTHLFRLKDYYNISITFRSIWVNEFTIIILIYFYFSKILTEKRNLRQRCVEYSLQLSEHPLGGGVGLLEVGI